jgi:hypothetical protein
MMISFEGVDKNSLLEPPHLGVAEPMDSEASSTQPLIIG